MGSLEFYGNYILIRKIANFWDSS